MKNIQDKYTILIGRSGSLVEDPIEESEQEPWVQAHYFDPISRSPNDFLGLFSEESGCWSLSAS
jgi:hypothetical protein